MKTKLGVATAALLASTALAHAADTVTITVSADLTAASVNSVPMYVIVDNVGIGSFNITADSAKSQTQTVTFTGYWPAAKAHEVGAKLNAYSGTSPNGSNLHVISVTLDGVSHPGKTLTRVDWSKIEFPVVATVPTVHDVLIGGYYGFDNLTKANTAGLAATGRGGLYLHNSTVNADPTNDAALRSVITSLVPTLDSTGLTFEDEAGENTFFNSGDQWDSYVKAAGYNPDSIILNCGTSGDVAAGTVTSGFKTWVNATRARFAGISVAPVVTPGGNDAFLAQDYGTGAHWANQRALEAYGARGVDDLPAANWNQTAWASFILGHAKWVLAQGLPYDLILSPSPGKTFYADVKTVVGAFKAAGVNPTRIIIENYTPGVGATVGDESDTTTLNAAALWVAQNK